MSGGYHDEDIITGHKKHVKRLNSKKDWGAELEHYRKNYTAVRVLAGLNFKLMFCSDWLARSQSAIMPTSIWKSVHLNEFIDVF